MVYLFRVAMRPLLLLLLPILVVLDLESGDVIKNYWDTNMFVLFLPQNNGVEEDEEV